MAEIETKKKKMEAKGWKSKCDEQEKEKRMGKAKPENQSGYSDIRGCFEFVPEELTFLGHLVLWFS